MTKSAVVRDSLVTAAFTLRARGGRDALTIRRIAEEAGTTTMAIYSRFGGRQGVLDSACRLAYRELGDALQAASPAGAAPSQAVREMADAYRAFALADPGRYEFMFERSLGNAQDLQTSTAALVQETFHPLLDAVAAAGGLSVRNAYCLWSVMHGLVGIELMDFLGAGLEAWQIPPDPTAAERMYRAGIQAMLIGLGIAAPE